MTIARGASPVIRIGFLPLADAAVVIAAAKKGFGASEGLELELHRANSWASLRDKLVVGLVDAAHLLAPLAMATHLGLGHVRKALVAPFRLSLDGNVICVSDALEKALVAAGFSGAAADLARALGRAVALRRAENAPPLALGTVFPASSHHALMRRLIGEAGLREGEDVRLVVLAPPLMVDALAAGVVDGFCVGAPWGGYAVDRGIGHIVAASAEFGAGRTEKLLALTEDWATAHPDLLRRLVAALSAAGRWCADPAHHAELAEILAAPEHLGLPAALIARTLGGRLLRHPGGVAIETPGFLSLGGAQVSRPDPAHVGQILDEIGEAVPEGAMPAAMSLLRPELFDGAASA